MKAVHSADWKWSFAIRLPGLLILVCGLLEVVFVFYFCSLIILVLISDRIAHWKPTIYLACS